MLSQEVAANAQERPRRRFQFRLRTLILLLTLVAVCLGMTRTSAVLGTGFVLAAIPALVRTVRAMARRRILDRSIPLWFLIGTFLRSLSIVVLLAVASLWTVFIACVAAGLFAGRVTLWACGRALSTCGRAAAWLARVSGAVHWLGKHALVATGRCGALNGRLFRRFWTPQG